MGVQQRTAAYKWDQIPGELPTASVPNGVDLEKLSGEIIPRLETLQKGDLTDGAVWRDFLSLTEHFRTFHSPGTVAAAYSTVSKSKRPHDFTYTPGSATVVRSGESISWIDFGFKFTTAGSLKGNNSGVVSVVPEVQGDGWKIWMLRTWLENYDGHGHPDQLQPRNTVRDSALGLTNGFPSPPPEQVVYDTIVVGAGQAGLSCAGRLKALGCSYIVLERNPQVGDTWTNRYESLRWHTTKEYGNLPFDRTYLPDDDHMLTTKQIGSGFKRWVERFGIDVRVETTVTRASWSKDKREWTVETSSPTGDLVLKSRNLVLACGTYATRPVSPDWPGRERFKGTAMHSIDYKSCKPWAGKRGVVVGTANTGHDVAEDMVLADMKPVTMLQRGKTFVFPAEWLHAAQDASYNMNMLPAQADRQGITYPNKIMRQMTNFHVHNGIDHSPERFDALEQAGFKLDRKGDIYDNLYNRFGGHYVDIGTSNRIAQGEIKMKGEAVKEWTEDGLRFEDGSEIQADLVVFCTGFEHDFRKVARGIIGEAADMMDDYFGVDAEGEVRGAFKIAGHPGLYYTGGDIRQCRFMSRFIALQIQADVLGANVDRYLETPS